MTKYSKVQLIRIKNKTCIVCGVIPVIPGILFCNKCREDQKNKSKKIRKYRAENNLCAYCGKPLQNNEKRACEICRKRQTEKNRKTQKTLIKNGRCPNCGNPATIGQKCEKCWFKGISRYNTGVVKNWLAIKTLIEKQKYKCRYTGKELIPGVNATIDHIIPISKGGTNDIENLQWVTERINRIKNDMDHDEFISLCKYISESF